MGTTLDRFDSRVYTAISGRLQRAGMWGDIVDVLIGDARGTACLHDAVEHLQAQRGHRYLASARPTSIQGAMTSMSHQRELQGHSQGDTTCHYCKGLL